MSKLKEVMHLFGLSLILFLVSCNHPKDSKQVVDSSFWDSGEIDLRKSKKTLAADQSDVGQMDYALFLYVFENKNPQRDAEIKAITDKLIAKVKKNYLENLGAFSELLFSKWDSFDGSDESIINIMRIVSVCGMVNTQSAFYAIPCAIIKKRPVLLKATEPYFGSSYDNFVPRCGLEYKRGTVPTFPKEAVDHYRKILSKETHEAFESVGSIKFAIWGFLDNIYAQMIFNPRNLISEYPETDAHVWKILEQRECKRAFVQAEEKLAKYYENDFGFDTRTSKLTARHALMLLVPNASIYE
jgi:hypothetical protein